MDAAALFVARSRKFIVALVGVVATFLSHNYTDEVWLTAALAVLDAIAVYLVPNASE